MTDIDSRPNNAYIVGERVWLRLPTEEDAVGDWYDWFNDEEVSRYTDWRKPNTPENQVEFVRSRVNNGDGIVLAVIESETDKHIGIVSLSKINWLHRFGDIALIVGDPVARQKAVLGLEAFTLMLRFAFLKLNLLNVKGGYVSGQKHSESILKALRFSEAGRVEDLFCIDGEMCDHVLVQLKQADWLARNKDPDQDG